MINMGETHKTPMIGIGGITFPILDIRISKRLTLI